MKLQNSSQRVHLLIQVAKSPRLSVQTRRRCNYHLVHTRTHKERFGKSGVFPKVRCHSPSVRAHYLCKWPGLSRNALALNKQEISLNKRTIEAALLKFMFFVKSISTPNCNWRFQVYSQRPFVRQFFINVKVHRLPLRVALLLLCNRLGNSSRAGHLCAVDRSVHVIFLWSQFLSQLHIKLIQSLHYFSAWDASCEISCCLTTWLGLEATATLLCFKPFANSRKFITIEIHWNVQFMVHE